MAQYELNIHDYWRIIKRRRWTILLTAAAILGSVMVFTNLQTPVYRAAATVKVESSLVIPGVATDQSGWDAYTALNTEVKIIKSTLVAGRAAWKLKLINDDMPEEQKQAIISEIEGKISAERIGDTNLITIAASSSDPDETANLANATAEVYIEKGIDDRSRRARELREFIEEQLKDAEEKLKAAEDNLRRYTEKTGAKGIGGYLTSRLLELQSRRSELLKKYTNQHPEVQRIGQQIMSVEEQMKSLPAEELESGRLTREVTINEELYTLLAKRFKEAQITEADRVQSAFIVTPATKPSAPIKPNRMLNLSVGAFLGIFFGFFFAIVVENFDTSIGTIEDVERYLDLPVVGIIPHIDPDTHPKTLPREENERSRQRSSRLILYHPPKSPFVESYHTLRTNLNFVLNKDTTGKGKIIIFTSAGIGEGKTLTASNYALAAAQSGIRTLLIEADLRRPSLHWIFGLQRAPGLSDCITRTRKWSETLRGTTDLVMGHLGADQVLRFPGIENLSLMTSGPLSSNPVDILNSAETMRIVKEMAASYDLVILDCPPILLFADALILGSYASGTVIVYQAGRIARLALKRAKDQLLNIKAPVMGVVLNNVKTSEMGSYYGYGYYYSYKYYENRKEDHE